MFIDEVNECKAFISSLAKENEALKLKVSEGSSTISSSNCNAENKLKEQVLNLKSELKKVTATAKKNAKELENVTTELNNQIMLNSTYSNGNELPSKRGAVAAARSSTKKVPPTKTQISKKKSIKQEEESIENEDDVEEMENEEEDEDEAPQRKKGKRTAPQQQQRKQQPKHEVQQQQQLQVEQQACVDARRPYQQQQQMDQYILQQQLNNRIAPQYTVEDPYGYVNGGHEDFHHMRRQEAPASMQFPGEQQVWGARGSLHQQYEPQVFHNNMLSNNYYKAPLTKPPFYPSNPQVSAATTRFNSSQYFDDNMIQMQIPEQQFRMSRDHATMSVPLQQPTMRVALQQQQQQSMFQPNPRYRTNG